MVIAIANNRFINSSNIVAIRFEAKAQRAELFRLHDGRFDDIGFTDGVAQYQQASELAKNWTRVSPASRLQPEAVGLFVREETISEYRIISGDGPERIDIYVGEHSVASVTDAQAVANYKSWLSGGGQPRA